MVLNSCLLPDLSVVMSVNCSVFFPGAAKVEGQKADQHWLLPEELKNALRRRLAGEADVARSYIVSHKTQEGLRARGTLPEVPERLDAPVSVRVTFRQPEPPELPFQVLFRQNPAGTMYPVSKKVWQKVEKLRRIRQERDDNFKIALDGGMTESKITKAKTMGVEIAYCGRSVFDGKVNDNLEKLIYAGKN